MVRVSVMTEKQLAYVRSRAGGMAQGEAAIAAGYARAGAKVTASRMERDPRIRTAIEAARAKPSGEPVHFDSAQAYLTAVVCGTVTPDPVRVSAARALLPFERPRARVPMAGDKPRQLRETAASDAEAAQLEAWAHKVEGVRARARRKR
jgi:hypothetical protein